jgi:hypothetical protein
MSDGIWPSRGHDLSAWEADKDSVRCTMANLPFRYRNSILYIKGDCSEYASGLGLPSWQDSLRPCFLCNTSPDDMYQFQQCKCPWRLNEIGDYDIACARCEVRVIVPDLATCTTIVQLLRYDKRQNGAHGRALGGPVIELGLKIGDRLEPGLDLQDISGIDKHAVFPLRVVFWRCSMETSTRHRNPLFMPQYGLDPAESLTVDNLHANNLGIMNVYAKTAVWHILGLQCIVGIQAFVVLVLQIMGRCSPSWQIDKVI